LILKAALNHTLGGGIQQNTPLTPL